MQTVGLGFIAPTFAAYGGYAIGGTELVATGLMVNPKTRNIGALLGMSVISGAIFFHLFTPLGVIRIVDSQGNTDGGTLFFMAFGLAA